MPTGIVIAPNLETVLTERHGIVTVPAEDAGVRCFCVIGTAKTCNGLAVSGLPVEARTLENHLREMGNRFIARMRVRGLDWAGGDLRLHGPWPSYEFNQRLADVESSAWAEAEREDDPSSLLPFVFERDAASPYSDYLLVGQFLTKATLTEVIVPDGE